jgi:hypothetical protein
MTDTASAVDVRTEQENRTMAQAATKKTKATKAKKTKKRAKKPAKVKAKKPAKKPAKKKPVSGQSGPPVDVPFEKLNDKESTVVKFLNGKGKGARNPLKIADIAKRCFGKKAKDEAQANSWTRNSLRRLVTGGWVEKMERGLYRIDEKGRKRLQRA